MSDEWEFFHTTRDNQPAVVFADLGLMRTGPEERRPWLLQVTVKLASPGTDGLGDRGEALPLDEIEDELFERVARGLRARYVGRITQGGERTFCYYGATDEGFAAAAELALQRFDEYRFESRSQLDAQGQFFRERLSPNPLEINTIRTQRQVATLREQGDDLTQPREVNHWMYFDSPEPREQVLAQVRGEGFECKTFDRPAGGPAAKGDDTHRYGLVVARRDPVNLDTLDPLVTDLYFRAHSAGGFYDGWTTELTR